jgi:hypothetical protein
MDWEFNPDVDTKKAPTGKEVICKTKMYMGENTEIDATEIVSKHVNWHKIEANKDKGPVAYALTTIKILETKSFTAYALWSLPIRNESDTVNPLGI